MEAVRAGVVASASLIVNLPDTDDAVARARSWPALALGLHLNFTCGLSLTDSASLTRGGSREFYPLPMFLTRAFAGLVDEADITRECLAQIDHMTRAGFPPTHLDSHRHVHAHPAISRVVLAAAAMRGISAVRAPYEPLATNSSDWRATLQKIGLIICGRLARQPRSRIRTNHFFGISLQGGTRFGERLFSLIPRLPAGISELMVHPGHADASLASYDGYTEEREVELKVLCSREFRELLSQHEIELIAFDRVNGTSRPD
jgi:predicted glycoside hydrolase/deacetylase ChbG (UPF0249 family)